MEHLSSTPFARMLKEFNELVDSKPEIKTIQKKLLEIKDKAANNAGLTYRQKEAIMLRVENYLKSDYFQRSKTPEQGKISK